MSTNPQEVAHVLASLKDPHIIRSRAQALLEWVKQGKSAHFALDLTKMMSTASFVIEVIQDNYPNLEIPYHSRWRHFEVGGMDRIKKMCEQLSTLTSEDLGKILYELVIISVFLDAGAGYRWRYRDAHTKKEYGRSEGLALASLSLYQKGVFSARSTEPLRVDAEGLLAFNEQKLIQGFQVRADNPLEGVSGRVMLLNQLGTTLQSDSKYFANEGRLGNFYTHITSSASNKQLATASIFQETLQAFNKIWPTRLSFHGVPLGDVWHHRALKTKEPGSEFIPFHKLTQWLCYSLIEPLEQAGLAVTDVGILTGLPEYRNGGLLIDSGLLQVKNPNIMNQPHRPDSEIIVEWRALTISLLDELAHLIRKTLQKTVVQLPLAKILQGGTWEAGRRIARKKRPDGTPPIQIISDGTVF